MVRIEKKRSGVKAIWPLADVLNWRLQFGGTIDDVFGELADLCLDGRAESVGVQVGWHPERANKEIPSYRLWIDPPTSHSFTRPGLAAIAADEWADLCPVFDDKKRLTSGLNYASCRLPAWREVEFDRDALVLAWLPTIQAPTSRSPTPESAEAAAKKPLRGEALTSALDNWAEEKYGAKPGATELPGRDELLPTARNEVSPEVTEVQIRDLKRKYASLKNKRGGARYHRSRGVA